MRDASSCEPRRGGRSSCRTTRSSSATPTPACCTAARSPRCSTRARGAAVFAALTEWVPIATLDLRIDYLRAAEAGRDVDRAARPATSSRATSRSRARSPTTTIPRPIRSRRSVGTFMLGDEAGYGQAEAMTLVERLAAAKRSGDYQALLDAVPYAKFLGLSGAARRRRADHDDALRRSPDRQPRAARAARRHARRAARVGGDLRAAVARRDRSCCPRRSRSPSTTCARARRVDTHARGIVTRHGRRVANVRVEAWQADRATPVATAHAIFLVMRDAWYWRRSGRRIVITAPPPGRGASVTSPPSVDRDRARDAEADADAGAAHRRAEERIERALRPPRRSRSRPLSETSTTTSPSRSSTATTIRLVVARAPRRRSPSSRTASSRARPGRCATPRR